MKTTIYLLLLTLVSVSCTGKQQKTADKLTFDSIAVEQKIKLLPNEPDSVPYATVYINFTYPDGFRSAEELKKLQGLFYKEAFGENYADAPAPGYVIDTYTENYTDTYRENAAEFNEMLSEFEADEFPYYRFSYFSTISNKIEYENAAFVSFSVYTEDYQGGAHGANLKYNATINLNTVAKIQESDIFIPDYKEAFAQVVRKKLLEQMQEVAGGSDDEVKLYFFDFDNIYPNNNFLMNGTGLQYIYNIYEIAPFASGTFEISIPYSEIMHLLKPDVLTEFHIQHL